MNHDTAIELPVPEVDEDNAPYWSGLRERKVLIQRCEHCERLRHPAMSRCPYCSREGSTCDQLSGRGSVYSWIVVRKAFGPEFVDEVPYTVATIDLDEGVRVVGRLEADVIDFGLRVEPMFVDHPSWVELRFAAETGVVENTTV